MGKIADEVDRLEDELADALEEIKRLEKLEDEHTEIIQIQEETIKEYQQLAEYIEVYHPGIETAFAVAMRMEK